MVRGSLRSRLPGIWYLVSGVLLGGCTVGPDYVRPVTPEPVEYREDFPPGESVANTPWWELFEDSVLVDLIDSALVNNRDALTSLSKIAEAEAALGIVRADLYPRINYGAAATADITTTDGDELDGDISGGLNATYMLDLWGRIRRSNEAAVQTLLASEEAYRAVTLTLIAGVAKAYVLLRDLDNRLAISERTVDARKASLDVIRARFNAGFLSEVDVNQAEIVLGDAEVSAVTFKRLRGQTENAISVLLGVPPMEIPRGRNLEELLKPPELPTGLPSDLLRRRPDILIAERTLNAQTARIGAAEALKFPQLNLTSNLGAIFTGDFTGFFDIGADLFGPLFNSGENQRRVDVEVARTEQLVHQYEQTILVALREVDDALIAVRTYEAEFEARKRQLVASTSASELSWVRFDNGVTSYLEVLDVDRSLFTSQLKASETLQLKLTSVVQLYQALGGGWDVERDSLGIPVGRIVE
ncbi:efflux transporter outer membrane subunit [Bacteroidota bacterium]